tara:strand:- start:146 stop:631 length:486 start_codon:yes stop_codon:yes gene_type:complete
MDLINSTPEDHIEALDREAFRLETLWLNADRLCAAVEPGLAGRFRAQLDKLNAAIEADDKVRIAKAASAMRRAWLMLDAEARKAGNLPPGEAVFTATLNGRRIAIYQPGASLGDIDDGALRMHIDEVVKFLPVEMLEVKRLWPGATVTAVNDKDLNDEIPF